MLCALVLAAGAVSVSCEDEPDKFKLTDGRPTVKYIRPQEPRPVTNFWCRVISTT